MMLRLCLAMLLNVREQLLVVRCLPLYQIESRNVKRAAKLAISALTMQLP